MTFNLDLWPTDLKINRDHLLTKDYLPTKFEASGAKRYWVISCTRLRATDIPTDIPTYRPTGAKQYALLFQRGGIPTYRHTDRQVQSNMPSFFKGGHKYRFWFGTGSASISHKYMRLSYHTVLFSQETNKNTANEIHLLTTKYVTE